MAIGLLTILLLAFFTDNNNKITVKETLNKENYYINEVDGYEYKVPNGYYIDEEFYLEQVKMYEEIRCRKILKIKPRF